MILYFIRHAQSFNNKLAEGDLFSKDRLEDPPLTTIGKRQAKKLGKFLKNQQYLSTLENNSRYKNDIIQITHLYTSLMIRSLETGLEIAKNISIPVTVIKDLHESGGIYLENKTTGIKEGLPGKTPDFYQKTYPTIILPSELNETGWWSKPYEILEERHNRAERVVGALMEKHGARDDQVALIGHGDFYNHIISVLLEIPFNRNRWFSMNNVAISKFEVMDGKIKVLYMNRTDFLPDQLITL